MSRASARPSGRVIPEACLRHDRSRGGVQARLVPRGVGGEWEQQAIPPARAVFTLWQLPAPRLSASRPMPSTPGVFAMQDHSPRLSLPFILPSQAQKHVTHNEALTRLDIAAQLAVEGVNASI